MDREEFLRTKAAAIRRLAWTAVHDITEIGRHLSEAKAACPHGEFLEWLGTEFRWSVRTAQNYMAVYDFAKDENFSYFRALDVSAIYLLARPSTPAEARQLVAERIKGGERPTRSDICSTIRAATHQEPAPRVVHGVKHQEPTPTDIAASKAATLLDDVHDKVSGVIEDLEKTRDASEAARLVKRLAHLMSGLDRCILREELRKAGFNESALRGLIVALERLQQEFVPYSSASARRQALN